MKTRSPSPSAGATRHSRRARAFALLAGLLLLVFPGAVRAQVLRWVPVDSLGATHKEEYDEDQAARRAWFARHRPPGRDPDEIYPLLPAAGVRWSSGGPVNYSGRTLAHAFHPHGPDTLWIGTDGGGVWRTNDGGRRWVPQTDVLPSLSTGCVAVRPVAPYVLLAGTNDTYLPDGGGVFRSVDGGTTWEGTSFDALATTCRQLVWHPQDSARAFMAVDGGPTASLQDAGVWSSTDAGRSWTRVLDGPARGFALLPATGDAPERLFATIEDGPRRPGGVYRSTDGGRSWQRLEGGLPPPAAFTQSLPAKTSAAEPGGLYVLVQNADTSTATSSMLYHTADGGATWTPRALPDSANTLFPPGVTPRPVNRESVWTLGVSPHDAAVVFAGGVNLFRSTDGGRTWTWISKLNDDPTLPWYDNKPLVGPPWVLSDTLVSVSSLRHTVHVDHQDLGFHPVRSGTVYTFNDGGVEQTDDLGATWTAADSALVTVEFYKIAVTTGWTSGGSQDNGLLIRAGAQPWYKWETGDGMTTGFLPTDERGIYLVGTSALGNYHTLFSLPPDTSLASGETSWQQLTTVMWRSNVPRQVPSGGASCSGFWSSPLAMDHHVPGDVFASDVCYVYRGVLDSTQVTVKGADVALPAGMTLVAVHPIPNVTALAVRRLPGRPAAVYAYADADSLLWRSEDGGATWDSVAVDLGPVTDLAVDPLRPEVVYATRAVSRDQVVRSGDGGRTWATVDSSSGNRLPPFSANAIVAVPDAAGTLLYVGMSRGVYVGREAAPGRFTWTDLSGDLPGAVVMDVAYRPGDDTIHAGTYGRGYWWAPAYRPR